MVDSNNSPNENLDAYSIEEFCRRHSISRGHYYNLQEVGKGPVEGHALGRVLITKESALEWRQKISAPSPTEPEDNQTPAQRKKQKRRP